jgi:replicative DNA helicase
MIDPKMNNWECVAGVPTPFKYLNKITGGWQRGELIILAARPSMGKTAMLLNIARTAAQTTGTAIFSLDLSNTQLVRRLVIQESHVFEVSEISKGHINGKIHSPKFIQIATDLARVYKPNLYIDDTVALSIKEFKSKAWRLKNEQNIELIIVDYLQLMTDEEGDKDQVSLHRRFCNISRAFKKVAKELGVPIIILSQLSRAVETRGGDKRPQLSDLWGADEFADIVGFLYRPEYYQKNRDELGLTLEETAELIIAKNSNESLGTTHMKFIKKYSDFVDF